MKWRLFLEDMREDPISFITFSMYTIVPFMILYTSGISHLAFSFLFIWIAVAAHILKNYTLEFIERYTGKDEN